MSNTFTKLSSAALWLGAALMMALLSHAAHAASPHLRAAVSKKHPDILIMQWHGRIQAPMSLEISEAFERNKDKVKGIELRLDSGGGSVKEGERVIEVLQTIRKTHDLHTVVGAGRSCGSMCVFIYVQGTKRLAAPASLWLFHEVSFRDRHTHKVTKLDRASWEKLVDKYWVPAGVSQTWIADVKTHTYGSDYWQSGESLLASKSNIITKALSNENHRVVYSKADPKALE